MSLSNIPQPTDLSLLTYHVQMAHHHDLFHNHHLDIQHQPQPPRSGASSRTAMYRGTLGSSSAYRGRAINTSEETQDTLPEYTAQDNDERALVCVPSYSSQGAVQSNLYGRNGDGNGAVDVQTPDSETREKCLSSMPVLQRAGELSHSHQAGTADLSKSSSSETLIGNSPPSNIAEHSDDDDDDSATSQGASSALDIQYDLPHSVYCKLCRKIHAIGKDPYLCWELRFPRLGEGKCPLIWETVDLGQQITLHFWFVHLIMRAQRLSPAHGLPLKDAAFTVSGPGLRHRRVAPLVGMGDRAGHLLLRIRSTFMFSCEDVANLAKLRELQTCRHQRGSRDFNKMCKGASKLALQTIGRGRVLVQLRKCSACSSEYELFMVNKAKRPCQMEQRRNPIFYAVLEHFIDLGKCEDNTSAEWIGLRDDRPSNVQVKLNKISEKGSVKQQFEGQKTVKGKRQKFGERVDRIRYLHKMESAIREPF